LSCAANKQSNRQRNKQTEANILPTLTDFVGVHNYKEIIQVTVIGVIYGGTRGTGTPLF